ncbi:MAG: hypothetical protein J5911_02905 [Clostridia bacterium]|nr:hypothetical protein [Clostridia bacterium]
MKAFNNIKVWIIIALIVVLAGAVFISVMGLNQTPDYKAAYEVSVSVDQNVNDSGKTAKTAAEQYFNEKGYKYSGYATQEAEDGTLYIFKFEKAGDISESELQEKLDAAVGSGVKATAAYKAISVTSDINIGITVLACALGLVAAFVIALFIIKLSGALVTVINAVLTALIYVSVVAIARVPAMTDMVLCGAIGVILALIMTFVIVCRYKESLASDDKNDIVSIAENGAKASACRLGFIVCLGVIAAIAFAASGSIYLIFTGLKILIAAVSAYLVSIVATPALFSALKNAKFKK